MYIHPMLLDRKLCEDIPIHHIDAVHIPDLFGFEIELEGKKLRAIQKDINAVWDMHNDGSLRIKNPGEDAIEYVLRRPLKLEDTLTSIDTLFKYLNSDGVEVFPSYRTSIHVHVNCAADPMRHVYNFITLSIIFDALFVSQNGEHRIGNNFCLRARDAQGQITELVHSIEHHGNIYNLNAHNRYSSVNFVSLLKYGTLEFRSLECTTDFERVAHWVNTIAKLKTACRQFDDPQDIIRYFSRMSEMEFLYFVLGAQASKYAQVKGFEDMLREGMRLAQDFAFASKWINKVKGNDEELLEKAPPKKKGLNIQGHDGWAQFVAAQAQAQLNPAAEVPQPGGAQLQNWVIQQWGNA